MAAKIHQQFELLKRQPRAYGGELMRRRKGRMGARPLSTKLTMHLVLRSAKAVGDWSFRRPKNSAAIKRIIDKFATSYSIQILSMANVGNHIHLHIRLVKQVTYKPFIRATTAAIAMAVTGYSRWNPGKFKGKFWDYRPFTRIIEGFRAFLSMKDYIEVNRWEGAGYSRREARLFILDKQYLPREFWASG